MILDTAFEMTREEGFINVTARKVAAKAGCSTQPIFRVYKNMEELWEAVYGRAIAYFQDYYSLNGTDAVFQSGHGIHCICQRGKSFV